jgi:hypothetical protein
MSTPPHKSKERMVARPNKLKRALCIHESNSRSEGPTLRRPGVIGCLGTADQVFSFMILIFWTDTPVGG